MENKKTIMIVDDEEYVLNSLKRLLYRDGYRILTALSAEEGYKIVTENEVQLIISDQRMPGESGTEFLAKIRVDFPDIIRTIISGYTDVDSITESINKGHIYKFFYKPWDENNLRLEIKQCLEQYELVRKNRELNELIVKKNKELEIINNELVRINTNLESIVEERTKDLEIQNKALELFRAIIEDMPLPVIGISSDGMIVMRNKKALEITHGNPGLEVGNYISDCFSFDLNEGIDRVIKNGELEIMDSCPLLDKNYKIFLTPLLGQFKGKGVTLIFV